MAFKKGQVGYWIGKKRPEMLDNKFAKGHIAWNKGLFPMFPFKKGNKLACLKKGKPCFKLRGRKLSEKHKISISNALKGIKKSEEHIKHKTKLPIIIKCLICDKEFGVAPCFGRGRKKYCSLKCRNLSKVAEKSHWWKGGISFEPYPLGWNRTFKEQIRFRDGYKCQLCGMPEVENGRKLDVHHKNYDKKDIRIENLISLCRKCHVKTNGNREYWEDKLKTNESIISTK